MPPQQLNVSAHTHALATGAPPTSAVTVPETEPPDPNWKLMFGVSTLAVTDTLAAMPQSVVSL